MSRVCPECGREYFGQTVKCIHCSIPLVEKSGSQVAQQARGRITQQTRQTAAHINSQRVQNSRAEQESARQQQQLLLLEQEQKKEKKGKQKNSTLGILALVFSILGCTFWIGIVLAIIDLCRKDGRKKILSISSIVICALWIGISVGASQISDSERKNSEPKNLKVESSLLEESDKIYKPKNEEERVEYIEDETKTDETLGSTSEMYIQDQSYSFADDHSYDESFSNEEETRGVTDVRVQTKNGDIDNFRYKIDGSTIYLEEYIGEADFVELKTTYTVDGIDYLSNISDFNSRGSYTKLIIDEGFTEVSTGIFNGTYVDEVFFPKSMTNVYDYTLAYMHNGEKNKIYYAGTREEWLSIFTRYKRKKVGDTEFGEEWGQAVADKVNEMIGVEYKSENFEYFFSASPDDLK